MTRIVFHPYAIVEIFEVEEQYAAISEKVVARFRNEVDAALQRVKDFPQAHPRIAKSYQWARLRRFPFLIIFRRKETGVYKIVAFVHERRRPSFWRGRT